MTRAYNFGAGPAMLPASILQETADELLDWNNQGTSILELGHRTNEFRALLNEAKQRLAQLLSIPSNYHIIFMGCPARSQFSAIPVNFLSTTQQGGYIVTGLWSLKAFEEAQRLKKAYCVYSNEDNGFTQISDSANWVVPNDLNYLYYTPNETVNGIKTSLPKWASNFPVMADMTSCLLTEPIHVADYDLIFAGAQKNIANAGLTIVIIKDSLLKMIENSKIPLFMDYRSQVMHDSLFATPPTFNCYLALKMFKWIEQQGGVDSLYHLNLKKSQALYQYIDSSNFYECAVEPQSRSIVNVCFSIKRVELEALFLTEAADNQLIALKGHHSVGGLRASLYNAMPFEGVEALIKFMRYFASRYKE